MVGTLPPAASPLTAAPTVPLPRRPLDASDQVRRWYENDLGWPTVPDGPGTPVRLSVGPRFDVLDVPVEAGLAALRHLAPGSPVAVQDGRMRLLLAAGSAEEVPGVLDWLEWGSLRLDLRTLGEGDTMTAPLPADSGTPAADVGPRPQDGLPWSTGTRARPLEPGSTDPRPALSRSASGALQGAAVWLRPPEAGCEVEASLPTLSALGGGGGAPDLVRVLDTVATQCHRLRLRACAQPPAFS